MQFIIFYHINPEIATTFLILLLLVARPNPIPPTRQFLNLGFGCYGRGTAGVLFVFHAYHVRVLFVPSSEVSEHDLSET